MPTIPSEKNKKILVLTALFLFGIFIRFLYYDALEQILVYPDSVEYIDAAEKIKSLKIDASRVPGYPLFIAISQSLFFFLDPTIAVLLMQAIASSAASVLLFIAAYKIFGNRIKAFLFFLFWSLSICVINWDFLILTESMTNVLMIMLVFFFFIYMEKKKELYLITLYGICLILLYTKPFYIALPLLVAAIALVKAKLSGNWKRTTAITLASLSVIYLSVFGYSYVNYKQNGYFGISNVSVINRFGKVLQYRMYEYGDNEKITNYIKEYIKDNDGELPIPVYFIEDYNLNRDNYSEISEYVNGIIKKHPAVFLKNTYKLITEELYKQQVFIDYNHVYENDNYIKKWPVQLFKLINDIKFINTFRFLLIILFIDIFYIIRLLIKRRHITYFWIFTFLIVSYQFGMSVIGAHGEYHRLMAPSYAFIFLIMFKYIYAIADSASKLPYYLRKRLSDRGN